ncbi:Predicted membrane protein [Halobacillus aidingensis]|uniref:Predicted membrane protein n=2 Tax=Halobacillus aidingensis TaxID=240303 RepID=A0A1H0EMN3_HALAD|nr:Predicted membrane protein [Halobacillus aidingensis]
MKGAIAMLLFSIMLTIHIIAGFSALAVFWIPLVTKKGGNIHRKVGWVYVTAMYTVAATALYMGIYRIFFDYTVPEARAFSFFLLFIATLSGATAWMGIRVLRFKRRTEKHRNVYDLGISCLLILMSAITMVVGWMYDFPLLQYFPILGIILGGGQLYYWLTPPQNKMHWYFEHYGNLIGCSIATLTAFTVFGAPRLLNISSTSIWLWLLPTVVLTPLIYVFNWYYRKKFKIQKVKKQSA